MRCCFMELDFSFRRYFEDKHSKYERNVSPGVEFQDVPDEAETIVLIMDDPDAPGEGAFTHWLIWNIPADRDLPEDLADDRELEFGAEQGNNDFDEVGYGGPKPPRGETHEYRIRAYALDAELNISQAVRKNALEQEIEGHVLDKAEENIAYGRDFDESQTAI